MNTAPLISRLQSKATGLRFIGGAMDLNESTLQAVQYPAAFVVPLGETAEPGRMLGVHDQLLIQQWAVVLVLRAMRTKASQDQSAELHTLRQKVLFALAGWTASADAEPMDFVGGELISAEEGLLLWQDTFSNRSSLRVAPE